MAVTLEDMSIQEAKQYGIQDQERGHYVRMDDAKAIETLPHEGAVRKGVFLALDLGSNTGWALAQSDGTVTSGTVEFRPSRFEGGGMPFLRLKKWLDEVLGFAGRIDIIVFEEVKPRLPRDA
ncbi:MAG: hypothetical protein HQL66_04780 [Magnetococcales bacterium]|nr:hypothetical protein [Magnetococcales bacterium]